MADQSNAAEASTRLEDAIKSAVFEPPRSFVTFCQVCTHIIPEERMRRNSRTCSEECKRQYRAGWLRERRSRVCGACGNRIPKQRGRG